MSKEETSKIHMLLKESFPKGEFLSHMDPLEFVAHPRGNVYFVIGNCNSKIDVDCKVLEYFSRAAYKTEPYYSVSSNNKFHKYFIDGINHYFGTQFTKEDIEVIYTYLGNACNHSKTIDFISSRFDMSILNS